MIKLNHFSKALITVLIIVMIILFPFWKESANNIYPALKVNDSSVGYYQSTTCNISLLKVAFKNINKDQNIKYNNNNYAGTECFGKVTGLDKVNDIYIVSIGTNSNITLLIQSLIWCLFLLLISKFNFEIKKINLYYVTILKTFFTYQQITEERFYFQVNKNFDLSYSIDNYYLINIFLGFYITFLFISIFLENNRNHIINYFPFMFLVIGSFNGFNLNFFSLLFSYIGLKIIFEKKFNKLFNIIYLLFLIVWVQTTRENITYFDTDKLKGFINTSNSLQSLLFWAILLNLIFNAFIYICKNTDFDFKVIYKNLLLSSNFIVIFGILGAASPLYNFFNYLIFGQNKRGIDSLSSVAGNTWRGFSPSAESVGEFYGFVILFFFLLIYLENFKIDKQGFLLIIFPIYGLYKTNNFAVILSLVLSLILLFTYKYFKNKNKYKLSIIIFGAFGIGSYFLISMLGFEYVSTQLLYEASLHSNFFPNFSHQAKLNQVTYYFDSRQMLTLFSLNQESPSSLLNYLFQIYQQNNFNVPILPNLVTFISFISILINRSEMWGIFIAKYNPNLLEAIFGNGPYQLNNYLYKLKVKLDVPEVKVNSLYLPHSSFIDLFIFFGILGFFIFIIWNIYILKTRIETPELKILIFFILLNFAKSDSLLYMNSLVLMVFSYMVIYKSKKIQE